MLIYFAIIIIITWALGRKYKAGLIGDFKCPRINDIRMNI